MENGKEKRMEKLKRTSGILLHITSLPNQYGWGNFSVSAFQFIDFLKNGGFGVWQVLPFSECLYDNSPYSAISSFAINPNFLDFSEFLSEEELVSLGLKNVSDYTDFNQKVCKALKYVCEKFRDKFDMSKFRKENNYWLDNYALFKVIKRYEDGKPWTEWEENLRNRNITHLESFANLHKTEIDDEILIQFLLDKQWKKIKNYASDNEIEIFGDMPFYVEMDSADVWSNPKDWQLENGKPKLVAGVPPDYFNSEGQLWGYPIYNYASMAKNNYRFWKNRIKRLGELFDIIRIDHFLAFARYWAIPSTAKSAKSGKWIKGAGVDILKEILPKTKTKIVAEDLGIVTEDVYKLKDKFEIPGVKVVQFAFDGEGDNMYKPYNFEKNCVAYIGTHDNNTMMGLLNEGNWDKINRFKKYLRMPLQEGNDQVIENLIVELYKSSANLIVFTAQDILHLGAEARLNVPGVSEGNWTWKLENNFDTNLCSKFSDLAYTYGRKK